MISDFKDKMNSLNETAENEPIRKTLFENANEIFQIIEILYDDSGKPIDGIYKNVDKNMEQLFNIKSEEYLGKRITELFPSVKDYWFSEWDKVIKSRRPFHFQNYYAKTDRWVDVVCFPYDYGHVGALYRDITVVKNLEQEERFKALTMATNQVIYRMSPDTSDMIQLNSRGLIRSTLEPDKDWINRYIPSEDQELIRSALQRALKNKTILEQEHRVFQSDNSIGWVYSRAVPIFNDKGDIVEWFGAANDITDRKIAEEQLLKREQELRRLVEMKDEFLAIISHEFKTPLNVIFSAIQVMEQRCSNELSEMGKNLLFKIKQNTFRQMRLVNNLLDITRINAGGMKVKLSNMEIVNFTRAITESVEVYARQKDITLRFSTKVKRKTIASNEEFYERIVLNLLSNAIKFSGKGGKIEVKLFPQTQNKNPMICLQVIDQGIGIPEDKESLIFERFGQVDSLLTRQAEGTGIGLSLVKLLVELLGGSITVDSDVGVGSTFTVLLPDKLTKENLENNKNDLYNDRIQAIVIEFSDIYLHI